MSDKLNQTPSAERTAGSLQQVVSCCWASDLGRCKEPATIEAYSTLSREWYPLCDTHRINIIAPLRKISQPKAAANNKLRDAAT